MGEQWRNGRLVDPDLSEEICVHLVGVTPGLWCGACNTHPEHPDRSKVTRLDEVVQDGVLTHKMCCVCFEYIPVGELWQDENGQRWDVCRPCAKTEAMSKENEGVTE